MANFAVAPTETTFTVQVSENTLAAANSATAAAASADDAAASASTAEAFTGPSFASAAAGISGTSDGDFFAVEASGIVTIYLNDAGAAVAQRTIATTGALASTDADKGQALIGKPTVAQLLASTAASRGTGSKWYAEGYEYQEQASASAQHLATAGGVNLAKVLRRDRATELMQRAAAIQGRAKPSRAQLFEAVRRDILTGDGIYFVSAESVGYTQGSLVMTALAPRVGTAIAPKVVLLVPVGSGIGYSYSVDVAADSGSPTVKLATSNTLDGSYSVGSAITPTGTTYAASGTSSGTYAYIGLEISGPSATAGVKIEIDNLSLSVDSVEEADQPAIAAGISSSMLVYEDATGRYASVGDSVGNVWMRHYGMVTGNHPHAVWASASGTSISGSGGAMTKSTVGTRAVPATMDAALEMSQLFVKSVTAISGLEWMPRPIVALMPGSYNEDDSGNNAVINGNNLTGADVWVVAPFGKASFTTASMVFGFVANAADPDVHTYLWNMAFDNTFEQAVYCIGQELTAYQCDTDGGDDTSWPGNGWYFKDGDFFCQECTGDNAANDGFGSHGSGHTTLVDCTATGNTDDGFSPHTNCTFEVWGGTYDGNGKGNIIPAFGAQGFCVGVTSQNQTGLSPRIVTAANAGFIALGSTELRPTVLLLIDCISTSDQIGVAADGQRAIVSMVGGAINTPVGDEFSNRDWESSTGNSGTAGILDILHVTTSARTFTTDAPNRIREFPSTVLTDD